MAEEILEIPIESPAEQINAEENINNTSNIPEAEPTITEKRGRGRPAGARNKAKAAPPQPKVKAKPKPKKAPPVEYDSSSSEEEVQRPARSKRAALSAEEERHAIASQVLGLLQQQRTSRATARREHYASWFQNMR